MKLWKIYGWRSPENKWYVGSTSCKTVMNRAGHDGYRYVKKCPIFGEAIQKFGWENMEQNILRLCLTKEEADYWERYYIKEKNSLYPNGYNLQDGGQSAHAHDYSKKKMSVSQTGRKHTPEELLKMSLSNTGKHGGKKVCKFSKDGQFIDEYPSLNDASKKNGVYVSNIWLCCQGRMKSAGGFGWRYSE